jgi:hypothetical protein
MMAMAFILIITTLFNIAARMHEMQNHGTKTSPHLQLLQHVSHIVTILSLSSSSQNCDSQLQQQHQQQYMAI